MSVYQFVQWSVNEPDTPACEEAVRAIAEHVRDVHPAAMSFRAYRQAWGDRPLRTYLCHVEYESLAALEADPDTPSCDTVWAPVFAMAQPGTLLSSIWSDRQRSAWFER